MKIGINALSITPNSTGGGTTYILELLNQLSQVDSSNKYIIFVRSDSKHHFSGYGNNFKCFYVSIPSKLSTVFRVLFELILMPFFLWFLKLDALFCPGDSIPLFSPCPTIMVIQNLLYFHFFEASTLSHRKKRKFHIRAQIWYYNYITRRSAIKADRIITVSENAKKEITEYLKINGEKISVVHHGLSPHFKEYTKDSEKVKATIEKYKLKPGYILYVGAIVPHKNVDTIVSAFSILKDRYAIRCQLVMAGSDHAGYSEHLKSIGKTLGVFEQMNFLGYVPYMELPALYNKAKVFVMLSLCESFGLPLLEAMACDCPVICSNTSSLPEIAGDGAILVDPKDPIRIAEAIKVLMEDEELRREMIIKGERRADKFSWREAAYKTLKVIENAVNIENR